MIVIILIKNHDNRKANTFFYSVHLNLRIALEGPQYPVPDKLRITQHIALVHKVVWLSKVTTNRIANWTKLIPRIPRNPLRLSARRYGWAKSRSTKPLIGLNLFRFLHKGLTPEIQADQAHHLPTPIPKEVHDTLTVRPNLLYFLFRQSFSGS